MPTLPHNATILLYEVVTQLDAGESGKIAKAGSNDRSTWPLRAVFSEFPARQV